jgi:branched-chain amino acid transport system substrate-binding protein
MAEADFSPDTVLDQNRIQISQIQGFVFLPDASTISSTLALAVTIAKLERDKKLALFGDDAMYTAELLCIGGQDLEGLVLSVPWHPGMKSRYSGTANDRWKGGVNWTTAMAYDATQAIVHSLSENATRQSIYENLKKLRLSSQDTSGEPLSFDRNGNSNREPVLVEVSQDAPYKPSGCQFGFKLIVDPQQK